MKLSFKLDFDEFEDEYTQIDNQRFYGFKKLSLKNNYNDKSFLREKVASEIFTNSGLAMSHTAFWTLYVDYGDGPIYFGLYTLVEEVDDTVIDTQFTSDDENLYKPDGDSASFVKGTFDEDDFVKKTNEDTADWSDIEALFTALNASNRTSAPATWRANLDEVIDTDIFLKYLAVNTVIQNWDTYGRMTHNYFLYNNPDTNKFNWIPWDNNESLQTGSGLGSLNLSFSNISSGDWPLIEYLYSDSVYKAKYDAYVKEVIEGPFETSYIQSVYTTYASLVEPYATSELSGYTFLNSTSEFSSAVSTLKSHASSRASTVDSYLY
jgi:spore coat protein CotH